MVIDCLCDFRHAVLETTEKVKTSVILRQRRRIFSFIYRIFRYAQNDKFRNFGLFQWFRNLKALIPLINLINITQPAQSEPPPKQETLKAEDNMMDFLDNF